MIRIAIDVFNLLTGTAVGLALFMLSGLALTGGMFFGIVNFIKSRIY